jgi:hypothetical protein
MSNVGELVERLVDAGLSIAEASEIIAAAVAAGAATATYRKSPAAIRQQRYRERNKASRNRNDVTPSETVTNRNEPSQKRNALRSSLSKEEKKEEVEVKRERRAASLPDGWRPPPEDWSFGLEQLGEPGAEEELKKFTDHALANGRTAKNWNAAWRNWVRRAVEYRGARNGQRPHFDRSNTAAGTQQSGSDAILAGVAAAADRRARARGQGRAAEAPADAGELDLGRH